MYKPSIGFAKEGVPAVVLTGFSALIFAIIGWNFAAVTMLALAVFAGHFFRDPERVVPTKENVAVSPADGKVIKITKMENPLTGEYQLCVCVFMNVFSVHVNRAPVKGTVEAYEYYPGKFFNAAWDKASTDNERCACRIKAEDGTEFTMVQIAGLVARRIIFWPQLKDTLNRGERFGLIRFGSRVDLYLPEAYKPVVRIGQNVVAGQTILAEKK